MGTHIRFEVIVFDPATRTYLSQQVHEMGASDNVLAALAVGGLFSGEQESVDRSIDTIEEWVYEKSLPSVMIDPSVHEAVTDWMKAIKKPGTLTWPGGFVPADDFPYGSITIDSL